MKKAVRYLTVFGMCSLLLGLFVGGIEKRKEKKDTQTAGEPVKRCGPQENGKAEKHQPYGFYERYLKRPFDFATALMALVFLSPVYLILAVLVRVKLGSPVLFTQERPGKDGKIFKLYKFRTMTDERDENGELLPDEVRLTGFGKKLRSASLDELPELFNVLKGDMALVGPRPQLVRDMVFMTKEQRKRHTVLPGLSGLAQIGGRNSISWEKKLELDIEYLGKITFWNDLKIILCTIRAVFKREGIQAEGMETAEDFGDYLLRIGKTCLQDYEEKQAEARYLLETTCV